MSPARLTMRAMRSFSVIAALLFFLSPYASFAQSSTPATPPAADPVECMTCDASPPGNFIKYGPTGDLAGNGGTVTAALEKEASAWYGAHCSRRCFKSQTEGETACENAPQPWCDCFASARCGSKMPDKPAAATTDAAPAKTKLVDPLGNIGIRLLVGRVTNMLMGLSGTFALVAFVFGGFKMITANGNEKKYAEGLNSLKWAVIGLVIIFGSYALLKTLFTALGGAAS